MYSAVPGEETPLRPRVPDVDDSDRVDPSSRSPGRPPFNESPRQRSSEGEGEATPLVDSVRDGSWSEGLDEAAAVIRESRRRREAGLTEPAPAPDGAPRRGHLKLEPAVDTSAAASPFEYKYPHAGSPVRPPSVARTTSASDDMASHYGVSPKWRERPEYEHMANIRKGQTDKAKEDAAEEAEKDAEARAAQVKRNVGPFAETNDDDGGEEIKFGLMRFQENGRLVPYLIIPEHKRDPAELLEALKLMPHFTPGRFESKENPGAEDLTKPSILFDICSSGQSYMEWAAEAYDNDVLSKAWGWQQWSCTCGKANSCLVSKCDACRLSNPATAAAVPDEAAKKPQRQKSRLFQCAASAPDAQSDSHESTEALSDESTEARSTQAASGGALAEERVEKLDKPDAYRQFVEQLMCVTKTALTCTKESSGWLFSSAKRDAGAQLCGDTISRFRGSLDDLVWVQYAVLQDPELFGDTHDEFVEQVRNSAKPLSEIKDMAGTQNLKNAPKSMDSYVHHPSNRHHYPSLSDLQMNATFKRIDVKLDLLKDLGTDISPCASHLLFFDTSGTHCEVHEQAYTHEHRPHDHIAALKQAMAAQGVSTGGLIMMNGDGKEMQRAQHAVSQLSPVVAYKSIGGASDLMARIFQIGALKKKEDDLAAEMREEVKDVEEAEREKTKCALEVDRLSLMKSSDGSTSGKLKKAKQNLLAATKRFEDEEADINGLAKVYQDRRSMDSKVKNRRRGFNKMLGGDIDLNDDSAGPDELYDAAVLREDLAGEYHFALPADADAAETVVVDVVPRNRDVHVSLQKNMAVMKEKQQDTHERTILGFPALERQLLEKAWRNAATYQQNGQASALQASVLDWLINIFNVLIVTLVIFKQYMFFESECEVDTTISAEEALEEEAEDDPSLYTRQGMMKVLLIFLPILNGILITLSSQLDPQTKARALEWADQKTESETYKYRCRALDYSASGPIGWSATAPEDDTDQGGNDGSGPKQQQRAVAKKLSTDFYKDRCKGINDTLKLDTTFSTEHLNYATDEKKARDKRLSSNQRQQKLDLETEEIDVRTGRPKTKTFRDDGYSRLEATEYLACRTQVLLKQMQEDVQFPSYKLCGFKTTTLVMTSVSVAFGSFGADLFIAISTAFVSFFSTAIENGDYKREVRTTNLSIKMLEAAELDWNALTFVQKRDAKYKDRLVRQTENAFMAVAEERYSRGGGQAQHLGGEDGGAGEAGGGGGGSAGS